MTIITTDFDGFVWARTDDGELCGPYETEDQARTDIDWNRRTDDDYAEQIIDAENAAAEINEEEA